MEKKYSEHLSEDIKILVDLLGKPEKGELNFDGKEKMLSRLDALRRLKHLEEKGVLKTPRERHGVNLHLHTNESFSVFNSPTEMAWKGYMAGLEVLGINDHYTIEGHKEFQEACKILGIKAAFNIEAMAMFEEAKNNSERYNDPKNPGRTYLCGKGVVHDLEPGSPSEKLLKAMRTAFRRRCEEITEKMNTLLKEVDPSIGLSFEDVLRLTPRGNTTERHIAQAVTKLVNRMFPKPENRREFLTRLVGRFDEKDLLSEDLFQDLIRNKLLKASGPAYVEEPPEAFPNIYDIVHLFRDYGAIPTYPVLGNPVTEKEKDLDLLFDELEGYGIFCIEVIPKRNTRKRLHEILKVARKHEFPVFSGTEHNTKTPEPLLDKFSKDPQFQPIFRQGAYLILGHQFLSTYAQKGYEDSAGKLTVKDRNMCMSLFSFAGTLTWPEDVLGWLTKIGKEETFKVVLGIYSCLGHERAHKLKVKPGLRIPDETLKKVHLKDDRVIFADKDVRKKFEDVVKRFITFT